MTLRWCDVSPDPLPTLADAWLAQRRSVMCGTCVHRVPELRDRIASYCDADGPRWPKGDHCGLWWVAVTETT
jgi:hypothetical protein